MQKLRKIHFRDWQLFFIPVTRRDSVMKWKQQLHRSSWPKRWKIITLQFGLYVFDSNLVILMWNQQCVYLSATPILIKVFGIIGTRRWKHGTRTTLLVSIRYNCDVEFSFQIAIFEHFFLLKCQKDIVGSYWSWEKTMIFPSSNIFKLTLRLQPVI